MATRSTPVDLGNRELVSVAIQADGSPGATTRTAITAASLGVSSCPTPDIRPFGLGIDGSGSVSYTHLTLPTTPYV